jgi:hypothetical protein
MWLQPFLTGWANHVVGRFLAKDDFAEKVGNGTYKKRDNLVRAIPS